MRSIQNIQFKGDFDGNLVFVFANTIFTHAWVPENWEVDGIVDLGNDLKQNF